MLSINYDEEVDKVIIKYLQDNDAFNKNMGRFIQEEIFYLSLDQGKIKIPPLSYIENRIRHLRKELYNDSINYVEMEKIVELILDKIEQAKRK